jgi:hypothetical protein
LGAGGVFPDRKVSFIDLDVQVELVKDGLGFDGDHDFLLVLVDDVPFETITSRASTHQQRGPAEKPGSRR